MVNEDSSTAASTDANNNNKPYGDFGDEFAKLSKDELVRGKTIVGIEDRCLELCKTYIGGSWANAKSVDDVTVVRISGGFTNQLYHVHLNESVKRVTNLIYTDEPSDVAIKLYQEKHIKNYDQNDNERLNDIIILTIMSQVGLGPKVYGIFNDGFVQGYYKHEQFRAKHQNDPKKLGELTELMARIHNLNVPINKSSNLLFKEIMTMLDFAYNNCQVAEIAKELNLENLNKRDIRDEYKELLNLLDEMNIPVVFCHNDFRGGNLLVVEPDQKILACDLEYCGYGSRGFDVASFLAEWGKKEIFDQVELIQTDEVIENYLKLYIEQCDRLKPGYSVKPENSLASHVREVKFMVLFNMMFFFAIMAKQTDSFIPSMPFDSRKNMAFIEVVYKQYFEIKEKLIADGTIKRK